jgi:hypothetical protein
LGLSTLRRIFDENYSKVPHLTTLDALAKYVGYSNWNAYKKEQLPESSKKSERHSKKINYSAILIVSVIVIVLAICSFYIIKKHSKKDIYKNVTFSYSIKESYEVPQSVTFYYNIKDIDCDKAQIWPLGYKNDVADIDKNDTVLVSSYGWYNTFWPKLVIDDSIVRVLKIDIQSHVWKTAVANYIPKVEFFQEYWDDKEIFTKGTLGIDDNILKKHNFTYNNLDRVYYVKATDFTNIHQDSLHFETKFKSKSIHKNTRAGIHVIRLAFEKSLFVIPVNENNHNITQWAILFNHFLDPQKTDLSIFEIKPNEWNTLSYRTSDKHLQIIINDSLLFESDYDIEPGHLKHVAFEFMGLGEVDYVRFYNQQGELIYNDEFD